MLKTLHMSYLILTASLILICDDHSYTRDLIPNISEVQDGKLETRQKKASL